MNQTAARLANALTLHRARGVENQKHLARLALATDRFGCRRQHHQRVVIFAHLLGEHGDLIAGLARQLPVEDEVAIHNHRIFQQLNAVAAAVKVAADGVAGAAHLVQGKAAVQRDLDVGLMGWAVAPEAGDNRAFRAGRAGVRFALLPVDRLRAGVVARRHGQRQAQAVASCIRLQQFGVAEDDADGFTCADIGDRGAEQVGTLLFDQAGLLAVVTGLLIGLAGLLALLNLAVDPALTDFQGHGMNGGALAGRQHVATLGKGATGVAEGLANLYFGDRAADLYLHVGIEQQRRLPAAVVRAKQEHACLGVFC